MTIWTDLLGLAFSVSYVDAGGYSTRVLRAGNPKGEPVILMHGISGHLEAFVSQVRALGGDFDLHLLDTLGHGFTDQAGAVLSMDRLSKHLTDYMDAVGIESAHLVGLSQGGFISAYLASTQPERVRSAVLVGAAGNPRLADALSGPIGINLRKTTRDGVISTDKELTRKRMQMVIRKPEDLSEELVDIRYTIYQRPEFQEGLDDLLGMTYPEEYSKWALTPEVLAKIRCEALIIWGEDDKAMGNDPWEYLVNGIEKTKLVLFREVGHWPQSERADEFNDVVGRFLRRGLPAVEAGTI